MRKVFVFLSLLIAAVEVCPAQVCGCTDPLATNYNAEATLNDGSCLYAPASIVPDLIGQLDTLLDGTSTLLYWNGGYWTYNDHNDWRLYRINSTNAAIQETLPVKDMRNNDTEEIAQDSLYLYFGDFGNNSCGCRQNLRILRVNKKLLLNHIFKVDTITFSYEDQIDFTALPHNSTDFDCEAFIAADDSLYLFTKQWISSQTTIYSLPKTPGAHIAHRRDTYNVQGLVTGATYLPEYRLVVLCGYNYDNDNIMSALQPFIVILYDFQGNNFFSGNKRRLDFDPYTKAQIEAIATPNALDYYITNEHFHTIYMNVITVDLPAKMQRLDLRDYLLPYLSGFPNFVDTIPQPNAIHNPEPDAGSFVLYPNPTKDRLHIDFPDEFRGAEYAIFNFNGQRVAEGVLDEQVIALDENNMPAGQYILTIRKNKRSKTMLFVKKE